ncbi:MAG TPA: hypothetical protein DIT25_04080 [Candidatus Moranbacteria bacterium]|nr:hypothetical protein [Candidatus Moranbacteria bacterium]
MKFMKRRDTFKAFQRQPFGVDCADCDPVYVIEKGILYSSEAFTELVEEGVLESKILEIAKFFIGKKIWIFWTIPIEFVITEVLPPDGIGKLFILKGKNGIEQPFYPSFTFILS